MSRQTHLEQGELDTARPYLKQALSIIEVSEGIGHKAVPMCLHELATLTHSIAERCRHQWGPIKAKHEVDDAERLFRCALAAAEGAAQQHGPQELNVPFHYSSLSQFLLAEGEIDC